MLLAVKTRKSSLVRFDPPTASPSLVGLLLVKLSVQSIVSGLMSLIGQLYGTGKLLAAVQWLTNDWPRGSREGLNRGSFSKQSYILSHSRNGIIKLNEKTADNHFSLKAY